MNTPPGLTSLPADLVSAIFKNCIRPAFERSQGITEYEEEEGPYQAPYALTHISRSLRRIALDTPQLWTTLHKFEEFRRGLARWQYCSKVGDDDYGPELAKVAD